VKTRIITALFALPIVIIPLALGGIWLYTVVFVAACIGLYEFNRAFQIKSLWVYAFQLFATVSLFYMLWIEKESFYFSSGVLLFILLFIFYVIHYPLLRLEHVFYGIVAFYYIPVMLSHIILVRENGEWGLVMVWMIFIISFGSDTFAYFVGRKFGRNKLHEKLSPNKTIEGAIGGILGASLLSVVYAIYIGRGSIDFKLIHYIGFGFMGAVGSVFSQFGDISASAMKRTAKIKDFGDLMPGHGGIIDRIDSILFVAPFVYYALLFILRGF